MATGFFTPTDPLSGTNPNLSGFSGIPRIPGESNAQYQARLMAAQQPYQEARLDRNLISKLGDDEALRSRTTLTEQDALRKTRLNDLATLLAGQTDTQFNRNIPGIANTAQNAGMLETSGFGTALSRDYTGLKTDMAQQIAKQGLADRDAYITGVGDITTNRNSLDTSGLERQFSVTDTAKANELALKLGQMGVPAPAKGPSNTDKMLGYAGPILSGVGAVKGAGASSSSNPYSATANAAFNAYGL